MAEDEGTREDNVVPIKPDLRRSDGSGPQDPGMEARVAKLEAHIEHIQSDINEIKSDVREIKRDGRAATLLGFAIGGRRNGGPGGLDVF